MQAPSRHARTGVEPLIFVHDSLLMAGHELLSENISKLLDSDGNRKGDVRARILSAALTVFSERGFDAATLKEITDLARVNIAAVNYHFQSKEELIRRVMLTYLRGVNDARRIALDECESMPGDDRPSVEGLIYALVKPVVEIGFTGEKGRALIRLMQHARSLPREVTNTVVSAEFDPVHRRFIDALAGALRGVSREEVVWRYAFARGALMHAMIDIDPLMHRIADLSGQWGEYDQDMVVERLVRFISAGMRDNGPSKAEPGTSPGAKVGAI